MKKILRLFVCILAVLMLALPAFADGNTNIPEIKNDIISANLEEGGCSSVQEWVDKVLAPSAGGGEEWYVIALRQSGEGADFSAYRNALLEKAENSKITSAVTKQRIALTFLNIGGGEDYISSVMEETIGSQGLMSWVFGLHLMNNGAESTQHTKEEVIENILSMQREDGGWCVVGENGDPDVTSMTIGALADYYAENDDVKATCDRAVDFLAAAQLEGGGYSSMGVVNPESAAQVICGCASIGVDVLTDARFIKDGKDLLSFIDSFSTGKGTYCHEAGGNTNAMSAQQVYYALTGYEMMKDGRGPLFIFDGLPSPESTSSSPSPAPAPEKAGGASFPLKPVLYIVIAAAAAVVCVLLGRKKGPKGCIVPIVIAVIAVLAVSFIKLEKADGYYGTASTGGIEHPIHTTISISCEKVAGQADYIPEDGIILDTTEIVLEENSTAYDQLVEACRQNSLQLENEGGILQTYISGIAYIYEFDFGDLSGWMFFVNGEESKTGCGEYIIKDGDAVEWKYTTALGKDF